MKQLGVFLLTAILLFTLCLPATAESASGVRYQDYMSAKPSGSLTAPLEGVPGYSYDKFDKQWLYLLEFELPYEGGLSLFGIKADGDPDSVASAFLYVYDLPESGDPALVSGLQWLVDDVAYSFTHMGSDANMTYTTLSIGPTTRALFDALKDAQTVSLRINYHNYTESRVYDPLSPDVYAPLIEWNEQVTAAGLWPEMEGLENYQVADEAYGASIK